MRLFALRHAERAPEDPTFDSPLLPEGHATAEALASSPSCPHFTHVYTSPFQRCLQTIAPLCAQCPSMPLRIEHALYEYMRADAGHDNATWRRTWTPGQCAAVDAHIDRAYTSWWPLASLEYGETEEVMRARATAFREHLAHVHGPDDVVLLVTHLSVVNALRDQPDEAACPMGTLVELM